MVISRAPQMKATHTSELKERIPMPKTVCTHLLLSSSFTWLLAHSHTAVDRNHPSSRYTLVALYQYQSACSPTLPASLPRIASNSSQVATSPLTFFLADHTDLYRCRVASPSPFPSLSLSTQLACFASRPAPALGAPPPSAAIAASTIGPSQVRALFKTWTTPLGAATRPLV